MVISACISPAFCSRFGYDDSSLGLRRFGVLDMNEYEDLDPYTRYLITRRQYEMNQYAEFTPQIKEDNNRDEGNEEPDDDYDDVSHVTNVYDQENDDYNDNKSSENIDKDDDKYPSYDTTATAVTDNSEILDMLQRMLSVSSLNSKLLSDAHLHNVIDLRHSYRNIEEGLESLNQQNTEIFDKISIAFSESSDYNGESHRKIMTDIEKMLNTVDELRLLVLKMQNIGQRFNYHQLLNALLKEIYGEDKVEL